MTKLIDLTGNKFGKLTVIRRSGTPGSRPVKWETECDCGNKAIVIAYNLKYGRTRSCGCLRDFKLSKSPSWKGGRVEGKIGIRIKSHGHKRASKNGYVYEHVLIAENALGKSLPNGAVVHHVDGNPLNNKRTNLVICESQSYHQLLHRRSKALKECGNANLVKCKFCKKYDFESNIEKTPQGYFTGHKACRYAYKNALRRAQRGSK